MNRLQMVEWLHDLAYRERAYLSMINEEEPATIADKLEKIAIELRALPPVEYTYYIEGHHIYRCPRCDNPVHPCQLFCEQCGQMMYWRIDNNGNYESHD